MKFFDFHHHNRHQEFGIYNLQCNEVSPNSLFSAGIHPKDISENFEIEFSWLKEISTHENCVAIGECGLDGLIDVDEKLQQEVFETQILLANEMNKPLIIHCVKRFSQLLHFQKIATVPMVVHGFNKRKTIGEDLLNKQFYLSFGKSVLYNVDLQSFLKDTPIDKVFLETDDVDFCLQELYETVATIKNMNVEELAHQMKENLKNLQISI